MKERVEIEKQKIGTEETWTVDARKLHRGLGLRTTFAGWIKTYLPLFEEGQDYQQTYTKVSHEGKGGRDRADYTLSLGMAKYLAMSSNTDKGKALVRYLADKVPISVQEMMDAIFDIDIPDEDVFVYAARELYSGRVKIGISKDPERRVEQLNVGNPEPLFLERYIPAPNGRADEALAHSKNGDSRIRGEWFAPQAGLDQITEAEV